MYVFGAVSMATAKHSRGQELLPGIHRENHISQNDVLNVEFFSQKHIKVIYQCNNKVKQIHYLCNIFDGHVTGCHGNQTDTHELPNSL